MTFYSFIKPYRKKIIFTLFCILIVNLLSLAIPWSIKIIIDDVLVNKNTPLLNTIILILLAIAILRAIFNYLRKKTSNIIGENIACDIRQGIYWHAQGLSLNSIKKITPAQILTRISNDAESIRRFLVSDIIEFIYAFLSIVFITAILIYINARLTLASLIVLPFFAIIYARLAPRLTKGYRSLKEASSALISRISEVLNGLAVVRLLTGQDYEKSIFSSRQEELLDISKKSHQLNAILWTAIEFFTGLGILSVLWLGGLSVIQNRMTAGDLVAFYSYLGMLFTPVIRLVIINSSYQEARASLEHINDILNIRDDALKSGPSIILPKIKGSIEFKGVFFGYTTDEDTLKDISFSIRQGETVAIVGASGAGKSTLINLLVRFFGPRAGSIFVDGHNLESLDLDYFRRQLAVVLQDDYLFSGTIKENICYPSIDAPWDKMIEASRIACLDEFVSTIKGGYEFRVGDRGMKLSSGQRQRIAIARALLREPSILILDEATSSVDAITENKIQQSIKTSFNGKTVIIVAHRFSTISEANKIIVLDKGRIVEEGSHDYLLDKQGIYGKLYFEQFKKDDVIPVR